MVTLLLMVCLFGIFKTKTEIHKSTKTAKHSYQQKRISSILVSGPEAEMVALSNLKALSSLKWKINDIERKTRKKKRLSLRQHKKFTLTLLLLPIVVYWCVSVDAKTTMPSIPLDLRPKCKD